MAEVETTDVAAEGPTAKTFEAVRHALSHAHQQDAVEDGAEMVAAALDGVDAIETTLMADRQTIKENGDRLFEQQEIIVNLRGEVENLNEQIRCWNLPADELTKNRLAEAIADIRGAVEKDAHNKHHDYDYATADAIYLAVRDGLAKAGLTIYQQEVSREFIDHTGGRGGTQRWLIAEYDLGFQTSIALAPHVLERVTAVIHVATPQSFAAVRTYALKWWIRGKCLLATGDFAEDMDSGLPAGRQASTSRQRTGGGQASNAQRTSGQQNRGQATTSRQRPANQAGGAGNAAETPAEGQESYYVVNEKAEIVPHGEWAATTDGVAARSRAMFALVTDLLKIEHKDEEQRAKRRTVLDKNMDLIAQIVGDAGFKVLSERINSSGLYKPENVETENKGKDA